MSYAQKQLRKRARSSADSTPKRSSAMADLLLGRQADGGRLFFLGVGGSAGNCAHAVNDFRKIAGIEAYAPTDNVSELTARTNDEGWATIFVEWLNVSRLKPTDAAASSSRSAAAISRRTSARISSRRSSTPRASARKVTGVVGRDGGYTAKVADACVHRPDRQPRDGHAALRGFSGGGLAPAGLASRAQGPPDQVGVDRPQMKRRSFSGSRRSAQPRHRARGQALPARHVGGARDTARRAGGLACA